MTDENVFFTERLVLRSVQSSDYKNVLKWENDKENWLQSGTTEAYKSQEIMKYVSRSENLLVDGQTRFIIDLISDETIGCVDLFDYNKELSMASVGVLIDNSYRKKGYGVEALCCLDNIAKSVYKIRTLKALILSENKNSIELFKKGGFIKKDIKQTIYTYQNKKYLQLEYYKKL